MRQFKPQRKTAEPKCDQNFPPCLQDNGDSFSLKLYVQPGAGDNASYGLQDAGNGDIRLKLKVRARAQDGAANEAVIKLLAELLNLPKSSITLTAGSTARLKTIRLPKSEALVKQLLTLLQSTSREAT